MPVYNWSTTAATNATADATINWAEGQAPSSVNDSARAMMAAIATARKDWQGSSGVVAAGTSSAMTLTTNQVFSSLANMDGQMICFLAPFTNAASATLNVDGLGAKPIVIDNVPTAISAGVLSPGTPYCVTYFNGVGQFRLHHSFPIVTASIPDAAVTLAKLANLAQNTFIGRYTASTGVPQALTLSTGLAVNSSTGVVTTTTNPSLFPGFLSGLVLSTAGSSATFGIAAGGANDGTNATLMALTSAYTKTTSAWALGTGNGALDTGAIATSTWYHVYLIARSDTGVVDVLVSTSASAPTMPASYDRKRRIGSMKTNGASQWTMFTQSGDKFIWETSIRDRNAASSASSVTFAVTVPTGIAVTALLRINTSSSDAHAVIYRSLVEADVAPVGDRGISDLASGQISPTAGGIASGRVEVLTDTSAQIAVRSAGATSTENVYTYGWIDPRGR